MGTLRFLLALSIIASHCGAILGLNFIRDEVAVQSFYIISGFYMSLILNEKYINKNGSYRLFISNRFLRIYPLYWATLIAACLFALAVCFVTRGRILSAFEPYFSTKFNILSLPYLILTNIFIFGQDIVMFLGINSETGHLFFTSNFRNTSPPLYSFLFIQQAWTLGLELSFYLIAPFLLRKKASLIVGLIILSLTLRLFLFNYAGLQIDPWSYRFFPTEIMFFLCGWISYKLYVIVKSKTIHKNISIAIFLYMLFFSCAYEHIPSVPLAGFPFSLKEIIFFTSIILAIAFLFDYFKNGKMDNSIGELSYPMYISHLLMAKSIHFLPDFLLKTKGLWIALLTILFAYFLNKFIARPIERFRQSRLQKNVAG